MKRLFATALLVTTPLAAATFTVTNTDDSGAGSLRQAIEDANANAGPDTIEFAIPGAGVHTIMPTSLLPIITGPVLIDGYTQAGSSVNTNATGALDTILQVEIDGTSAPQRCVTILGSGVTVRGLVVNRCDSAIQLITGATGNVISGNFLGTDPGGLVGSANQVGVDIAFAQGGTIEVTIGGPDPADRNLISGNSTSGIRATSNFNGSSTSTIYGNVIGLAGDGVNYLTPSATVGGELLRVRLLGPHAPASLRWASVSVAKIGQSLAQAVFILLGLAFVLPRLVVAHGWLGWPGALGASMAAGAAAMVHGVAFVWAVGQGFWATTQGLLGRLGLGRLLPPSWAEPGRDLDAALARLSPSRVAASLGCFVAGWIVGAVEIYLILHWVGGPVDWPTAVAIETGSVLIDGILFFVPAKVGTQEGGKVVLFATLGLSPARGLTVGIVRRIRELAYAGLGLLALGWLSARAGSAGTSRLAIDSPSGGQAPRRA